MMIIVMRINNKHTRCSFSAFMNFFFLLCFVFLCFGQKENKSVKTYENAMCKNVAWVTGAFGFLYVYRPGDSDRTGEKDADSSQHTTRWLFLCARRTRLSSVSLSPTSRNRKTKHTHLHREQTQVDTQGGKACASWKARSFTCIIQDDTTDKRERERKSSALEMMKKVLIIYLSYVIIIMHCDWNTAKENSVQCDLTDGTKKFFLAPTN